MDGGGIATVIFRALEFASNAAKVLGDLETARRVEEILDDRFPTFPRRAAEKAEEIRHRLEGSSQSSP